MAKCKTMYPYSLAQGLKFATWFDESTATSISELISVIKEQTKFFKKLERKERLFNGKFVNEEEVVANEN